MQRTIALFSSTLHNSTPFVEAALQLFKLQLAHRNATADKNREACRAIEGEFMREVEAFRPCFTMAASLEVAQTYSKRLYGALRYFGMEDDPLVRQLDLLMGRAGMREGAADARAQGVFKGAANTAGATALQSSVAAQRRRAMMQESQESTLPSELPNPPRIDPGERKRDGAIELPLSFRGHWVLQEPEIAITRKERREDPW